MKNKNNSKKSFIFSKVKLAIKKNICNRLKIKLTIFPSNFSMLLVGINCCKETKELKNNRKKNLKINLKKSIINSRWKIKDVEKILFKKCIKWLAKLLQYFH